jgi:formate-dependent nitrite reductase membrane component NrfD
MSRDMTPATGHPASPDFGEKTGAKVPMHRDDWGDGAWSYLYKDDTAYTSDARATGEMPPLDGVGRGMLHAPVWTWEVPLYFWFGGIASGAAFVAFACDLAGDHRTARLARLVSLGTVGPCAPLLIMDLGRPERFLNMLRIFKPRSPMSMGAWALTVFSSIGAGAIGADLLGRPRIARALGAVNAVVGGYLGSYTGVLLASTAVPVWARSRSFLGPIFVATATATGASTVRLVCLGAPESTRTALGHVQAGAMATELVLSEINERRLKHHFGGKMKAAKWLARAGLAAQATRRTGPLPSLLYLIAGLLFRYAWVEAGVDSARDDRSVAEMARSKRPLPDVGVSPGLASPSSRP